MKETGQLAQPFHYDVGLEAGLTLNASDAQAVAANGRLIEYDSRAWYFRGRIPTPAPPQHELLKGVPQGDHRFVAKRLQSWDRW